ncbi:SprT family zinc-dependent metalloprotease [Limnoglobus roseus]|uniref:SprT domain-containing protein n=1 Tax=Limnoglobus roseus TaxID=2598579 RepID=A0A5C1AC42_9BACT|nr:SprT-like domain-containing protein [Limnoglobus roseus]QEL15606.1 sprT domain-containing protein [Limnoglobus roseus]
MKPVPDDQFAAWWRAARSVAEVVEKVGEAVGGVFPRWAVIARAVAGRKAGFTLPPLPDEVPVVSRRREPEALARVRELAEGRMKQHGLIGWQFGFNSNVRRAGVCRYPTRTRPGRIELSRHFIAHNSADEILDTILHELAHALVGHDHGHDAVWRAKCVEIGARPERCYGQHVAMPKGRWQAVCPGCSKAFDRHRRPKRVTGWHCKACGSERGQLLWRCVDQEEE